MSDHESVEDLTPGLPLGGMPPAEEVERQTAERRLRARSRSRSSGDIEESPLHTAYSKLRFQDIPPIIDEFLQLKRALFKKYAKRATAPPRKQRKDDAVDAMFAQDDTLFALQETPAHQGTERIGEANPTAPDMEVTYLQQVMSTIEGPGIVSYKFKDPQARNWEDFVGVVHEKERGVGVWVKKSEESTTLFLIPSPGMHYAGLRWEAKARSAIASVERARPITRTISRQMPPTDQQPAPEERAPDEHSANAEERLLEIALRMGVDLGGAMGRSADDDARKLRRALLREPDADDDLPVDESNESSCRKGVEEMIKRYKRFFPSESTTFTVPALVADLQPPTMRAQWADAITQAKFAITPRPVPPRDAYELNERLERLMVAHQDYRQAPNSISRYRAFRAVTLEITGMLRALLRVRCQESCAKALEHFDQKVSADKKKEKKSEFCTVDLMNIYTETAEKFPCSQRHFSGPPANRGRGFSGGWRGGRGWRGTWTAPQPHSAPEAPPAQPGQRGGGRQ